MIILKPKEFFVVEMNFDIRGNLKPYGIIEVSLEVFQKNFVDAFEEENTRQLLFSSYKEYMNELIKLAERDFYQWIDGSFITNKRQPKDIDVVTILDYRDYETHKKILDKNFTSTGAREKYNVDAYIVVNYPENHKKSFFTKSDLLYWRNLFSKTKVNRVKKQYERGIIQLKYNQNGE